MGGSYGTGWLASTKLTDSGAIFGASILFSSVVGQLSWLGRASPTLQLPALMTPAGTRLLISEPCSSTELIFAAIPTRSLTDGPVIRSTKLLNATRIQRAWQRWRGG